MNSIEVFFLNIGCSFTIAKFLPYFLLCIIGWFLARFIHRRVQTKTHKRWLLAMLFIGTFIQPVLIYFAINPIYQGDLADLSYHPKTSMSFGDAKKLVVIALPGCKYCSESTQHMKGISSYTNVPIEYWVLGSDSADLKTYNALVGSSIRCRLKPNLSEVLPITKGSFPTYVLIDRGKIKKAWHNDAFGVRALNELN
ncbi:MAG: hypothetical protein ACKO4Y_01585 [Flavobacteriales bacterium]